MKKGFTLIELLAVIIILAIIALIATPIILNVVEDARISAGKSEAQMIYSGINNYCASSMMEEQLNGKVDICADGVTTEEVSQMVNLGNAIVNKVTYSNGKVTELEVESNNHTFKLCGDGSFVMDEEECGTNPEDPDVGLVGDAISETVLEKYPYLATTGNGCTTSNENNYSYMGGCYLKGKPTDNYLWYSGFLWRIMGINADGSVRLITEENVTGIPWGASGTAQDYDGSHAKDWLNNYFYPRLKGNDIIVEQTWCSETTTSSSSARTSCSNNLSTEKAKVGSISLDEYNLAGAGNSYLNIGQYQWTLTPYNGSGAWYVNLSGSSYDNNVRNANGLRAVINVNSNVTITGGNGTLGETWSSNAGPYILNEDKSIEVTGKLNEKATSGEYVLYAGKKYRVVDKDSNGNTKLILDGYYEENGSVYKMEYGDNNTFSTTTGIGQKLNNDVLEWLVASSDTENRNKLVTNYTWYQNEFYYGDSYTISLEENNPTRSINATVGLIRVGEMLSSQSSSILTKGYTTTSSDSNTNHYWTMTPSSPSSNAWGVDDSGFSNVSSVSGAIGLRAVIVVNSNVTITGGNGTWSSPYEI